MSGFPCPECQAIMPQGSQQCWRCGWDTRSAKNNPMMYFGKKNHLLLVFNINRIEYQTLCARVLDYHKDTGNDIYVLAAAGIDQPAIQIWDLDNIQNGEPIPPEVIEKLKET